MKWAYYNEINRFAAQWLRELIKRRLIADGEVDERSIADVDPVDLAPYRQCHFFAGIGTWSYALRQAGWPDDRAVWTGSCPCQPFSNAGRHNSHQDSRHLWPSWFQLIRQRRPHIVFGEQVSTRNGLAWFDAVSHEMETADYTIGALDIPAYCFRPHRRHRLYFVAHTKGERLPANMLEEGKTHCKWNSENQTTWREIQPERSSWSLVDHDVWGSFTEPTPCLEPRFLRVDHGHTSRVGRLRGYGNAIVAPVAEAFIKAVMEIL